MQANTFIVKLVFAAGSLVPVFAHAGAEYPYRVTVLQPFTPGQGSGVGTLINNYGLICGMQSRPPQGFCYYRGVITELQPLPGHMYTVPSGLNDLGQVVGVSYAAEGPRRAVIFVNGAARELAVASRSESGAGDINNLGQIVGALSDVPGESLAFVSWLGIVRELGTLGGPRRVDGASSINDRGQIVGAVSQPGTPAENGYQVAFLYDKGKMRALPTPAGSTSNAAKINLLGQVVGSVHDTVTGQTRPVLWQKGRMKVLVDQPGDARDINVLGQVVGGLHERTGGFLYRPSTGARDVNELIDPMSGYTIVYPQAINDRQQIVGFGCKELLCGPVLLDPVHPKAETAGVACGRRGHDERRAVDSVQPGACGRPPAVNPARQSASR